MIKKMLTVVHKLIGSSRQPDGDVEDAVVEVALVYFPTVNPVWYKNTTQSSGNLAIESRGFPIKKITKLLWREWMSGIVPKLKWRSNLAGVSEFILSVTYPTIWAIYYG